MGSGGSDAAPHGRMRGSGKEPDKVVNAAPPASPSPQSHTTTQRRRFRRQHDPTLDGPLFLEHVADGTSTRVKEIAALIRSQGDSGLGPGEYDGLLNKDRVMRSAPAVRVSAGGCCVVGLVGCGGWVGGARGVGRGMVLRGLMCVCWGRLGRGLRCGLAMGGSGLGCGPSLDLQRASPVPFLRPWVVGRERCV